MSFKQLVSYFGRVNKQVEAGLYNVKRVYSFLRRIAESDEQYAKEIKKHTQHEEQRRKGQQEDAMMQYLMVVVDVQEVVMQTLKKQEKFAADVRLQVVKPLEDFHDKSEDARKKLAAEERRVSTQIGSMKAAVSKERQACFKLWEEMLKVKKERDDEEARETTKRSNFDKLCAKLLDLRKKASQQFAKFEKLREQTLAQLAEFRSSTMPSLLEKMNQIEKDRLMILKIHLNAYMALYKEYRAPIPRVATFETMLGNLNPEPQLQNFVDNIQRIHPDIADAKEEEVFALQCDLPCAASYVLTDQWFSAGGTGGPAQPVLAGTALPPTPSIPAFATQPQSSPRSSPPPPAGPAPSAAVAAPVAKAPPPSSPPPPSASGSADAPVFLRALYDFMDGDVAAGDLLFKTGDIIRVVHRDSAVIDPNLPAWWDGVVFGLADGKESNVGHFPSNYTEAVPPNEYEALVKHYHARRAAPNERKQPAPPPFNPPTQRLTVVSRPSNAVPLPVAAAPAPAVLREISESAPEQPPPQPPAPAPTPGGDDPSVLATAIAFYDYEYVPCGDPAIDGLGYIRFSAGDSILVLNMEDPEWWVGVHPPTGATGFFPANLVSVQRDPHVARLSVSY